MLPLDIALKEYGTLELVGKEHNPRILQYFKEIGHSWVRDDETAWCAAFVNWCLMKAGLQHTGKLNARSFLEYGIPSASPKLGDLVVLWRIQKQGAYGHVGFYISETENTIFILAGNQTNGVNIQEHSKRYLLGFRKIPE